MFPILPNSHVKAQN